METPMARGVECLDGWFGIIDDLCGQLTEVLMDKPDPTFTLTQVKQKVGQLRVYTTHPDDPTSAALIRRAVEKSRHTCEQCGSPGAELGYYRGPMETLCPKCVQRAKDNPEEQRPDD